MKMHLETSGQNLISNYGTGVLSVNGRDYSSNLLITANSVQEDWFSGELSTLSLQHFESLFAEVETSRPEILVLGTGSKHVFPQFSLIAGLKQHGIAMEVMTTRAACRTYSVLVNEYRSVAAALIQIE